MIAFTILGLPAHPLVVHGAVVGIPLAALGVIAYVLRPTWRPYLAWPVFVTVAVAWVFSILAGSTGETLEHALRESQYIEEHAEWAERLGLAVHVLAVSSLLAIGYDIWRRTRAEVLPKALTTLRAVAAPVAVVAAVAALAMVGIVGHYGAKAAWHDSPAASASLRAGG